VTQSGYELYLMGSTSGRLDGSALLFDLGRFRSGRLDPHDYVEFRECERFLVMAAGEDALAACHDISDGGLIVALAEMCPTGADVDLSKLLPDVYDEEENNRLGALFSEEGHRWIVAVNPDKLSWVRTAAFHFSVPLVPLGKTADGKFSIGAGDDRWFEVDSDCLNACYRGGLAAAMEQ
jgi:phosphoribosylformylglycinamidine synthase